MTARPNDFHGLNPPEVSLLIGLETSKMLVKLAEDLPETTYLEAFEKQQSLKAALNCRLDFEQTLIELGLPPDELI